MNQSAEKSNEVEPVLEGLKRDIRARYKEQTKQRPNDKVYIGIQHDQIELFFDLIAHIEEVHPETKETIAAFYNQS